ncbi:DUF6167 family protein [Micropruina sp.]|uniref:DUF6167 family protein n=1 Tax=Micropruina sp. TaxID=2737536 RepID=UPI0039E39E45
MRRRLFWFAVGVGVTALLVVKGREIYERFTPKGVTEQVEKTARSAQARVTEFFDTLSSAMNEREAELREALSLDETGLPAQEGTPVQESDRS